MPEKTKHRSPSSWDSSMFSCKSESQKQSKAKTEEKEAAEVLRFH